MPYYPLCHGAACTDLSHRRLKLGQNTLKVGNKNVYRPFFYKKFAIEPFGFMTFVVILCRNCDLSTKPRDIFFFFFEECAMVQFLLKEIKDDTC